MHQVDADRVALDLAAMPPEQRAAFMYGVEAGIVMERMRGERTHAQAMQDLAAHYVRMVHLNEELERTIPDVARRPDFAELSDRRGQPARAAAARRLWRERGIAS